MKTEERRKAIKQELLDTDHAISASTLATKFGVSRQVIVGDIALLKATKEPIIATARGYLYQKNDTKEFLIACLHNEEDTKAELETIIDLGGIVENVIVSHPVYQQLIGSLHLTSRYEINEFINLCKTTKAKNLSSVSNGVHYHTLICKDQKQYYRIVEALKEKGFLYENGYFE